VPTKFKKDYSIINSLYRKIKNNEEMCSFDNIDKLKSEWEK
jgi:hypothetical protein